MTVFGFSIGPQGWLLPARQVKRDRQGPSPEAQEVSHAGWTLIRAVYSIGSVLWPNRLYWGNTDWEAWTTSEPWWEWGNWRQHQRRQVGGREVPLEDGPKSDDSVNMYENFCLSYWSHYSDSAAGNPIKIAAKRYLTPPPTSTNIEHLFSTAHVQLNCLMCK